MKKKLYLVRGTGFKTFDGSMVEIVGHRDDGYVSIIPYNVKNTIPLIVRETCLQDIGNKRNIEYIITIEKRYDGIPITKQSNRAKFHVVRAIRDVDVLALAKNIEPDMVKLLRME